MPKAAQHPMQLQNMLSGSCSTSTQLFIDRDWMVSCHFAEQIHMV